MKIYAVTFYVLSVLVIEKRASAKSFIFNKFSSGPSLDNQKTETEELGYEGAKSDLEKSSVDSLLNSYKRSAGDLNYRPSYKRNVYSTKQRKRSPYGLVYNQGKPIGILEPISQSFEYSTYNNPRDSAYHSALYKSQWFPSKRDTDVDEERDETDMQSAGLHSSNYANVLAKFKVNNKVKHRPYQDFLYSQQVKREASQENAKATDMNVLNNRGAFDLGDLSSPHSTSVAKVKRSESTTKCFVDNNGKDNLEKIVEIEENLKDVMSDMGLVEKDKDVASQENEGATGVKKREIYFEDEDLENGLNKIGLTKESHYDRNKKENCPGKTKTLKSAKAGKRQKVEKSVHKKLKKKPEQESDDEDEDSKRSINSNRKRAEKTMYTGDSKTHIANYQNEGEAYIRSKRQEKDTEKTEDSDIMKGLEQSGDLTVSGNKSPLVAVTSADDFESKKNQEKRDKEELEYEKRLERNIQAKINAIKAEVKREISKIKTDDEKLKDMQRKKRDITNTLLDEETSDLDPGLNIDQKLEPYVRKRRDLDQETDADKGKRDAAMEELKIEKSDNENIEELHKNVRETHADSTIHPISRDERSIIDEAGLGAKKTSVTYTKPQKESRDAINEISEVGINTDREKNQAKRSEKVAEKNVETVDSANGDQTKDVRKRSEDSSDVTANIQAESNENEVADKSISKRSDKDQAEKETNAQDDIVKRAEHAIKDDGVKKLKRNDLEVDLSTGKTIIDLDDFKEKSMAKDSNGQSSINEEGNVQIVNEHEDQDQSSLHDNNIEQDKENREERSAKILSKDKNIMTEQEKLDGQSRQERNSNVNKRTQMLDLKERKEGKSTNDIEDNEAVSNADRNKRGAQRNGFNDATDENENNLNKADVAMTDSLALRSIEDNNAEENFGQKKSLASKYLGNPLYNNIDVDRNARKIYEMPLAQSNLDSNFGRLDHNSKNDLKILDDDTNIYRQGRKRRETMYKNRKIFARHKRDGYSENEPEYMGYRAEGDGEFDEEGDEMDDDGFNDQTSNFVNKRQADYDQENENYEDEIAEDYPSYMDRNKRNTLQRVYEDDDADDSSDNFLFYPNRHARRKRQDFEQLVATHGGDKVLNHLAAIRERNMRPIEKSYRRKRLEKLNKLHAEKQNIADLSESDIFGGLPQSYEGELSRFKRVKRSAGLQT